MKKFVSEGRLVSMKEAKRKYKEVAEMYPAATLLHLFPFFATNGVEVWDFLALGVLPNGKYQCRVYEGGHGDKLLTGTRTEMEDALVNHCIDEQVDMLYTSNFGRSFDLNKPLLVDGHAGRLREFIRTNRVNPTVEHIEKSEVVSVIQLKTGETLYTGHMGTFEIKALPDNSMMIERLARAFAKELTEWLGEEKMQEIVWLNALETDRNACHTHDFCDPNQAIIDVFEREDLDAVAETDLSNAVWDMAKANSFYQPVNA